MQPLADQGRDRAFLFATAGGQQDQLGKLRTEALEQRGRIAAQRAEIGDQNAAAAADQQIDGGVSGGSVPDCVFRAGGLAQRREQPRIRRQYDDIYDVPGSPELACSAARLASCRVLCTAFSGYRLTRGTRPVAPSDCAS